MKVRIGPHQRAGKRRRRLKTVIIAAILIAVAATTSLCMAERTEPGRWDKPSESELEYARKYYEINGENGDSNVFLGRYPEKYAPFIRGEAATVEECEATDNGCY